MALPGATDSDSVPEIADLAPELRPSGGFYTTDRHLPQMPWLTKRVLATMGPPDKYLSALALCKRPRGVQFMKFRHGPHGEYLWQVESVYKSRAMFIILLNSKSQAVLINVVITRRCSHVTAQVTETSRSTQRKVPAHTASQSQWAWLRRSPCSPLKRSGAMRCSPTRLRVSSIAMRQLVNKLIPMQPGSMPGLHWFRPTRSYLVQAQAMAKLVRTTPA